MKVEKLIIDNFHDAVSDRNGIRHFGWIIKCHTAKHRYVLCYWYVAKSVQLTLAQQLAERLVAHSLGKWYDENARLKNKEHSAEIHYALHIDGTTGDLQYEYAYHRYIPDQDVVDHFHPFSIN